MGEELVEDVIEDAVLVGSEMPENIAEATKEAAVEVVNQTKSLLHLDELKAFMTWDNFLKVLTSIIAMVIFYVAYRVIKAAVKRATSKKLEAHTVNLITRAISYVFYLLIVMYILNLFGINLLLFLLQAFRLLQKLSAHSPLFSNATQPYKSRQNLKP